MRLPPLPRTILLGMVYLALHLGTAVLLHEGVGTNGPGPWLPSGIALAFLIMGGLSLFPFVLAGNLLSAYVVLPAGSELVRFVWPLLLASTWSIAAFEVRRISGLFRPWNIRCTAHFALCVVIAVTVLAALGAALLKSGPQGSVLPLHSLALGIIEPQLLGALLAAPIFLHFGGALRLNGTQRRYFQPESKFELLAQLFGLLMSVWLVAHTDSYCWTPALVLLVWIAVRQGLAGGGVAALLLCYGASVHHHLTLQDMDGLRPILVFELAATVLALALGAWSEESRAKRQRLQESCDRVDLLMEHGGSGIWDWQAGKPILFEGAWHKLCSLPPGTSQVGEEVWFSLIHPEDLPRVRAARDSHLRGESTRFEEEYRLRSSSGFYRWVFDRGIVMHRDSTGRGLRMVGLCMDLSSRKHAEHSQLRFMDILDASADPVAATDLHGNVYYANRSLLSLQGQTGIGGAQPRHISDFFSEASAKQLLRDLLPEVMKTGSWWGHSELIDAGGHEVPVSVGISLQKDPAGNPRSFGFMMRLMEHIHAERPKLDAGSFIAASRQERQDSLRLLSGGAVHAFNNVLMAIMGNAFLARKDLPKEAPARHYFLQIDQASQRGSQLCHSLQLIAGKVHPGSAKLDMNEHLQAVLPELHRELKHPELLVFTAGSGLPVIVADGKQVTKALGHLLRNAFEAYGDNPGPVHIKTSVEHLDPLRFESPSSATLQQKGDHVVVEVSDGGPGLDESLLSRVFDPFFTTKAGHKGIGLAEVAGVLRGHGGGIQLESQLGAGFCIRLCFPLLQLRPGSSPTRPPMPVATTKWKGSGQVLIVDDEETVREVAASMLELLGFSPLVAKDGVESLRVLRQHADSIKLILLDYSMPIMDGESTLAEFTKVRPDIPVLFMSGHEARDLKGRISSGQLVGVLTKPFTMEVLQVHVRKALGLE